MMANTPRWAGLDLFRGFAIYAVILLHTDEGLQRVPVAWNWVIQFSGFAVPFFLAASFFLAARKLISCNQPYPLKNRVHRLVVPYVFWTILYLVYKFAKYIVDNDWEKISKILEDPIGIFFFGGAAFHLYFIPLLIVGTCLLKIFELINIKKLGSYQILFLLIISIVIYQSLLTSQNEFNLASLSSFEPILESISSGLSMFPPIRFLAAILAWLLRCLPYLLVAILIAQNKSIQLIFLHPNVFKCGILILTFLLVNILGNYFLPSAIHEILRGYLALLVAVSISTFLKEDSIVTGIGAASFGIYLMHLIVLEGFQITSNRIGIPDLSNPSLILLFLVATLSFIITWLTTVYIMQYKNLSRLVFGS